MVTGGVPDQRCWTGHHVAAFRVSGALDVFAGLRVGIIAFKVRILGSQTRILIIAIKCLF